MKRNSKINPNVICKQNIKSWAWNSNMKRGKGSRNGWVYNAEYANMLRHHRQAASQGAA